MKNYKIDYAHNTIVIDYKFAKAAQEIGSPAYCDLKQIKEDFPYMQMRVASHRDTKACHHNKNLTYANMIRYMSTFTNREELLVEFATIREEASCAKQPYTYVRDWFVETFPDYDRPEVRVTPKESFRSIEKSLEKQASSKNSSFA